MGDGGRGRRWFVALLGAVTVEGVAGCTGSGGGAGTDTPGATPATDTAVEASEAGHEENRPPGVSETEFVRGPVPEVYRTARSQAGELRDPATLRTKDAVRFAEADESEFAEPGQTCGNCAEYIPDRNGDGFGACAKVEGYVDTEDWCVIWESIEEHETEAAHE